MKCKFVEKENLHISLSFLGELVEGKVKNVGYTLEEICKKVKVFNIESGRIKLIPNEKYFRVIALDILPNQMLDTLQNKIKELIGGSVTPPHITICRVKKVMDKETVVSSLKSKMVDRMNFNVTSIYLMRSILKRNGPVYSVIKECKLHNLS